jgi:hypothetical protein
MNALTRFFVLLAFALSLPARAQSTSPAQFLDAYRDALTSKSVEKIDDLSYRNGMSDADKQNEDASLQKRLDTGDAALIDVAFAPLPVDYSPVHIAFGKKWQTTYPATGMVKATYKGPHREVAVTAPYAIIDGGYYLTQATCTDLGWTGPRDRVFLVQITPKTPGVLLNVEWNASGVEQKRTFDASSSTITIIGQNIEKATADNPSDDVQLSLVIRDGGKELFHSPPHGKGTITYPGT